MHNVDDIGLGFESQLKATCIECGNTVHITRKAAYRHACPLCGNFESSNEYLIDKILRDNHIEFYREYLINSFEKTQLLDFYIPKLNLAIEHQGNQHYNENNGYYNEGVLKRDRRKFASCMLNGIGLVYTYENCGLMFNQLSAIFLPYGIYLKRHIGTTYPPANRQWEFIQKNPNKSIKWYTDNLNYGEKTFLRYLKMCGFVGLIDSQIYLRWRDIPDDEFLDYLAHNGLRCSSTHYDKTVKTITTHLYDFGYSSLYELQMERKTIIDAYEDKVILDSIISNKGLKGASEELGFPKYVLEHYLPKLGYKNYTDVVNNYNKGI